MSGCFYRKAVLAADVEAQTIVIVCISLTLLVTKDANPDLYQSPLVSLFCFLPILILVFFLAAYSYQDVVYPLLEYLVLLC